MVFANFMKVELREGSGTAAIDGRGAHYRDARDRRQTLRDRRTIT